ncbi:dethiobiotin synthase [Sulfurimonas aquatica]|uniref:ATP-dependent dethiobiotin synthetase BioD n=1 Tax=Sulfurimonas aquatica TaxID=2672570 RepID=A0A975B1H1_9BACT|nr:dethiobiotin synthase [Sulfurimonas aquatica]QSZ42464.1 dethiobiotin synthase [Sulfurimonas aquatica]
MARRIFITATNTDIGKTYTTKLLLKEYASRGLRVGVIKPIETGVINGVYPDGTLLLSLVQELNPEFKEICIEDIVPISYELPAAPYVASDLEKLDLAKINSAIDKLEPLCDVLLIEGAGGLYVPIDSQYMIIDLIKEFKASALLVTHCSLGCINDTLLSSKALMDAEIDFVVAFNCRDKDSSFSSVSEPYFINTSKKVLKVKEDIDTISDVLYNFTK